MIEGTRMSVIFSKCIRQLIAELISAGEKAASPIADLAKSWTHGVVYTPYSNYAGIYYLRDIEKIPLVLAKTGVKYVHHESIKFDFGKYLCRVQFNSLGVYFESNGHGDVTFDRLKMNALKEEYKNESNPELRDKLDNFFNFLDIVNDVR
jgi:phosphoacetylglucosamine mutase